MAPTPPVGSVGLPGPQGALIAESDPRYNDVVLAFLQNHGFSRAEEAFRKDIEAQNNNSPQPQDGEGAQPAASTSKAGGAAAAGAAQPTASGSKPAAGTPTAASNTLSLPTLIQKSSNVPNPRQAGQQAPLGGPTPPDAHVVFNYLLQTLPPASLTALGLTAAAAAKAAEERDRRAAVGASIGNGVGGNIVKVLEPMERVIGYEGLKRWVESGLEGWKAELRHLLFPVFVHTFLDLVATGFPAAARSFFETHSPPLRALHFSPLSTLSSVSSPAHIANSPLARRFRSEKYVVRMSRGGFGLLVGWISSGGVEGEWEGGTKFERGKEAVRGVVNERIMVDVAESTKPISSLALLTETGLLASHMPGQPAGPGSRPSPSAFNESQGPLKLGIPLLSDKLAEEVKKQIKAEDESKAPPPPPAPVVPSPPAAAAVSTDGTALTAAASDGASAMDVDPAASSSGANGAASTSAAPDASTSATGSATPAVVAPPPAPAALPSLGLDIPVSDPSLLMPTDGDLIPLPQNFRTFDVKREVNKILDARKRIRLGPLASAAPSSSELTPAAWEGDDVEGRVSLPSVCAYTFHDNGEGVTSTRFSDDMSLLAAGSEESVVRIWSLKGEKLKGLRSDYEHGSIRDASALKKVREKPGSAMRKLVGHSGPVYSLSFSPLQGSAAPPKHMLSSSQDGTVRLWSLESFSALAAYKGHQEPVWDVEWGPMGVYFATGSRDRTARIWGTERSGPLRVLVGHLGDVECVKFHPNSLYLATGSSDRTCRLWDIQRGSCVRLFVGHHDNAISALAISPDGRYLASAAEDHAINLWDLGSSRLIKKMTGHTATVNSLAFSAESALLVSGAADCTVRVWDVKSAETDPLSTTVTGLGVPSLAGAEVGAKGAEAKGPKVGGVGMEKGELPMRMGSPVAGEAGAGGDGARLNRRGVMGGLQAKCPSLLTTFPTKRTPVLNVQFTPRNLVMCAGVFSPF